MSESNEAFVYFSSGSSGEKVNFDVLDKAGFVSNALGHNVCTDLRRTESDVNNSNHVSSEQKKEDVDRRQMVDLTDLQNQLLNIRVDVERLSIPTRTANLRRTVSLTSDNSASNKLVTTCDRQKPADLIRRYCWKCKITVADVSVSTRQLCAKCGTLLDFQCIRCDMLYSHYRSMVYHLDIICNRQNLDLKCPKCDYQTYAKSLMSKHKYYCSKKLIYSCNRCKYTTNRKSYFHKHTQIHLKDNDIEAHGDLVAIGNTSDNADDKEKDIILITTGKQQKPADLIIRYCSKCELIVADVSVSTRQLCAKCGTLLDFQCIQCDMLYSHYRSMVYHLQSICNSQNLNLKCPKCDYQTNAKYLMSKHLNHCTSGIIYSCSYCKYMNSQRSNLYAHMRRRHKDICHATCSKCRGEPNKCHQCKNTGRICENCHVGFGSRDRLQEHYESCKK